MGVKMARRRQENGIKKYAYPLTTGLCVVVVVALVFVLGFGSMKLKAQRDYYVSQEEWYNTMIANEQARSEELDEQKTYVQTKQYVEDVARTQLHLVYPDEYVFVSE